MNAGLIHLPDHYADTLMREKKAHNAKNLTREGILKIINKTDEEFKQSGASIKVMDNVYLRSLISKQDCTILTATLFTNTTPRISTVGGL